MPKLALAQACSNLVETVTESHQKLLTELHYNQLTRFFDPITDISLFEEYSDALAAAISTDFPLEFNGKQPIRYQPDMATRIQALQDVINVITHDWLSISAIQSELAKITDENARLDCQRALEKSICMKLTGTINTRMKKARESDQDFGNISVFSLFIQTICFVSHRQTDGVLEAIEFEMMEKIRPQIRLALHVTINDSYEVNAESVNLDIIFAALKTSLAEANVDKLHAYEFLQYFGDRAKEVCDSIINQMLSDILVAVYFEENKFSAISEFIKTNGNSAALREITNGFVEGIIKKVKECGADKEKVDKIKERAQHLPFGAEVIKKIVTKGRSVSILAATYTHFGVPPVVDEGGASQGLLPPTSPRSPKPESPRKSSIMPRRNSGPAL